MRIYSLWGNTDRNDIVVQSIEVQELNGDWSVLPGSAFGYSKAAAHNTLGDSPVAISKRLVRFYDDNSLLSSACKGLRINFGYQDHTYGGFMEIEAYGEESIQDIGGPANVIGLGITYARVNETDVYSFTEDGVLIPKADLFATRVVKNALGEVIESTPYHKLITDISVDIAVEEGTTVEIVCSPWSDSYNIGAGISAISGANTTVVTNGIYAIYTFRDTSALSSITFEEAGYVDVLVVAGGGGGGMTMAGGGGAGGVLYRESVAVVPGTVEIGVGAGGAGSVQESLQGSNGSDSWFGTVLRSIGGGGGGSWATGVTAGLAGGSGGGSSHRSAVHAANIPGQGNPGGAAYGNRAGGGGGAGTPGENGHTGEDATAGSGGDGILCSISGIPTYYGGGGGGGCGDTTNWDSNNTPYSARMPGQGGKGGGGKGAPMAVSTATGENGVNGLGGGGGGGSYGNNAGPTTPGGNGGSGVVIVRTLLADLNDTLPDIAALHPEVLSQTSARFSWQLYSLGAGATSADVSLRYGLTPDALTQEVPLASDVTDVGAASVELDFFSAATTYYAEIVVRNDASSTPEVATPLFSFTTSGEPLASLSAGLWQVRFDGSATAWEHDVMSVALGTSEADRQRALGTYLAYTTASYTNDFTGTIHSWRDNCTWAYAGYIFLEAGWYTFNSSIDDTVHIRIDGETTLRFDSYTNNGTSTWQCPVTGWHSVDIRVGNGSHGAGPMSGVLPENALHFRCESSEWRTFFDEGDASFLATSLDDVIVFESCTRGGNSLRMTVRLNSGLVGSPIEFCYSDTYSSDETDWTVISLGTIAEGEILRQDVIELPETARFFRYRSIKDDVVYRSHTRSVFDLEAGSASNPAIAFSGVRDTAPDSADISVNIIALGEGATSCDVVLSYGLSPTNLTRSYTWAEKTTGPATLRLDSLLPDHVYYGSFHAVNSLDGASSSTTVFSFRTASVADDQALPTPGLWQVRVDGNTFADVDVLSIPLGESVYARHRSLGAQMAYIKGSRFNDFEPSLTETWQENSAWVYAGSIYLKVGTIRFNSNFDDIAQIKIGDEVVHMTTTYQPNATTLWDCPATGWYPIRISLWNYSSAAGPMDANRAQEGLRYSYDNGTTWNTFVDPGDGSLLRTTLPFREITVDDFAFDSASFTANLSFGESDGITYSLFVAYGTTFGGNNPADWDHTERVTDIAPSTSTYAFSGFENDASVRFVRFYFGTETSALWSPTLYRVDASAPALASPLHLDGHLGDTLIVSGTLLSSGAADTATVAIEVSTSPEMTDAIRWPVDDLAAGETFTATLHASDPTSASYLQPGTTYYVRAVAEVEGDLDLTPATEFTLLGAPAYGSMSAESTLWNAMFTIGLSQIGAGDGTSVTLLTGASPESLTNTATVVLTEPGNVLFPVEFSFVNETVTYAFHIEAACDTVSWDIITPTATLDLKDTATFTWNPAILEGNWSDPASWISSNSDPRSKYPDYGLCNASFASCTAPTIVHVNGDFAVNKLTGTANLDVTFVGTGRESSRLRSAEINTYPGMSFTLKNMYQYNSNGWISYQIPENGSFRILEGAYFQCYGQINQEKYNNTLFEIRDDSLVEITDWQFYMSGENARLILDDSTFTIPKQGFHLATTATAKNNIIEFFGTHPLLTGREFQVGESTDGITVGDAPEFLFHAPRGGYEAAPVQNNGANWGTFPRYEKQSLRIVLAQDSELCLDSKATTQLVDWRHGILPQWVDLSEQPLASSTHYHYTWANGATEAPSEGAAPLTLWVTYEQNPTLILFR